MFEADDPALDAAVAVKLLADHHSGDPAIRERFIREARLLRRADSRRLVAVHDIGESDGRPYLVMELLTGGTLADRLQVTATPTPADLLRLVDEIELCLSELRLVGIVHRDLKPANLFIRSDGASAGRRLLAAGEELVVGDFGLARLADASGLTVAGGTDGFMAPEQRAPGSDIDHRADIFAATAIIAAAVTGRPPADAVPALRSATTPLAAAIARGSADDPGRRHRDAAEWADELRAALTQRPEPQPSTARPTRLWQAVAAVMALMAGTLAVVLLSRDEGPGIVGPRELRAGDSAVYSIDDAGEGIFYWTDWLGRTHEEPTLRVSADGPGRLPISLTEVVDGQLRSTTIEVTVRPSGG